MSDQELEEVKAVFTLDDGESTTDSEVFSDIPEKSDSNHKKVEREATLEQNNIVSDLPSSSGVIGPKGKVLR